MSHRRTRYSTPRKGTKLRAMVLRMLRPQGATTQELVDLTGWPKASVGANIDLLRAYGGWDIRGIPIDNPAFEEGVKGPTGHRAKGRHVLAYRIVGRDRWAGGYRSLIGKDV